MMFLSTPDNPTLGIRFDETTHAPVWVDLANWGSAWFSGIVRPVNVPSFRLSSNVGLETLFHNVPDVWTIGFWTRISSTSYYQLEVDNATLVHKTYDGFTLGPVIHVFGIA